MIIVGSAGENGEKVEERRWEMLEKDGKHGLNGKCSREGKKVEEK